jgi:nitronate monooxygenase
MFLCSSVALAVECCKAGIVGSLTRNHCRDMAEFEVQLTAVDDALRHFSQQNPGRRPGPLAVNISTSFSDGEMREHLALCKRHGADIVITSVGNPTSMVSMVHDAGLLHFHDATTLRFAEKAIAARVDGIVAIGAGGGGHSGTISHLAFIPQIRAMFDGIVVLAGAVSNGAIIRAAEVLGADLSYLGTRFIATHESGAPDAYKAMLVAGESADVMYTNAINGLPASWLKASIRSIGMDPDDLPKVTGRTTDHLPPGQKPWRDIWSAGQGIGLIDDVPSVAELVERLQAEYVAACRIPDMSMAAESGRRQHKDGAP